MSRRGPRERAAEIDRLRALRSRPPRDLSIAPLVASVRAAAERTHLRLGDLIEIWQEVVPPDVLPHTAITALRGGVVYVTVDSAPVGFELDRLLRTGLLAELRRRHKGTVSRVRTRVGGS